MSNNSWDIKRVLLALAALAACMFIVAGCGGDDDESSTSTADTTESVAEPTEDPDAASSDTVACDQELAPDSEFFDKEECETQLAQRNIEPEGDPATPWLQMIEPEMVDTSEYKKDGDKKFCFSNAANDNPWRNTGFTTMQATIASLGDGIEFESTDAEGSDEKQISDIEGLVNNGNCDILIISPATTATLTPAVESACDSGIPVVVFDRGVNTDCPVTFVTAIGGYAFGADGAEFIVNNLEEGDKVLMLRILPGVDVLENRYEGAMAIFSDAGIDVVGAEQTGGDPATTKEIVADYLEREGQIDGLWMDAGATAVAAIEAFEDAGAEYPVMNGEDQMDFLRKWDEEGLTAIAPVFSNFQWRTAVLAADMILKGEEVPKKWVLPQNPITQDTLQGVLDQYSEMGQLFYATCGCDDLPGFPEDWPML